MVNFVTFTSSQREREKILKRRIEMCKRGLSDVDGKKRLSSEKCLTKTTKDLKKLYDKVYKKR